MMRLIGVVVKTAAALREMVIPLRGLLVVLVTIVMIVIILYCIGNQIDEKRERKEELVVEEEEEEKICEIQTKIKKRRNINRTGE